MRCYYTLTQDWISDGTPLGTYFEERNIHYDIGVECAQDLYKYKYVQPGEIAPDQIVKTYIVLLDEHELSAIKLCVDKVRIIENRKHLNFINRVRGCFRWFLN